jgi:Mn2+/Fe2+ NRAMP family transporter
MLRRAESCTRTFFLAKKESAQSGLIKPFLSGLVSAASDNDPTTVATLAVAGAATVYRVGWLVVLIVPMFAVMQALATRVASVTHRDLQSATKLRYGKLVNVILAVSIVAVNLITLAADLQAGATSLQLITHVSESVWLLPIAVGIAVMLTIGSFDRARAFLAVLPLAFFTYIIAAFMAHPVWSDVARGLIPQVELNRTFVSTMIALLGTSLTSYTFVYQTIAIAADRPPPTRLKLTEAAAIPGTVLTGATFFFILIATGATLGTHHLSVQTAQDAAKALAPVAGHSASIVFGVGLLGSALLAVPVLASATAHVCRSAFGWQGSLRSPRQAPQFYATLYGSLAIGTLAVFLHVPSITLLFYSSIAAGLATPIALVLIVLLSCDKRLMRTECAPPWLMRAGWATAAIVTATGIAYLITTL